MLLAILLTLTLALTASAQLLTLELDQVIELPSPIAIWDVIPDAEGNYLWVNAVEINDSITRVYWSHAGENFDSLDFDWHDPASIFAFWGQDNDPWIVLCCSNVVHGIQNYTKAQVFQLSNGNPVSSVWEWNYQWYGPPPGYVSWTKRGHVLRSLALVPPPPQVSTSVTGFVSYLYQGSSNDGGFNTSWAQSAGFLVSNMLGEYRYSSHSVAAYADFVQSDATIYYCSAGWYHSSHSRSGQTWVDNRAYTFIGDLTLDQLQPLLFDYFDCEAEGWWPGCNAFQVASILDEQSHFPIVVIPRLNALTGYSLSQADTLSWAVSGMYRAAHAADVIPEMAGEEILGYRVQDTWLHVFRPQDGYWYGVTTAIPPPIGPMRIVSRHHDDFRRLAVQSGDQVRLFRFGEYLGAPNTMTELTSNLTLHPAFPNPFNPTTEIAFDLARRAQVTLTLFDVNGRKVATLADEVMSAGSHSRAFDGSGFASGVYLYRLEAGDESRAGKMVLLK